MDVETEDATWVLVDRRVANTRNEETRKIRKYATTIVNIQLYTSFLSISSHRYVEFSTMASHSGLTVDEFRLLSWTRPELSRNTIQPESLERHCPLDNGRLEEHTISPSNTQLRVFDTGDLRALPLEIAYLILSLLDLRSLTDFRAVSWGSRALVDSLPQYKAIIQHAPNALRALLSTNMAVHFTTSNLFEALYTQVCFGCGQFGPFLDLFTCYRYCLTCVIDSNDLLSTPISTAKREFNLTSRMIRTLPTCLSLPGQYTESERTYQRRISLVRVQSIMATRTAQPDHHALSRRRQGQLGTSLLQPSIQQAPQRWDGHGQNPYRFMPMVRIPALNQTTGKLDWGVSCQGCRLGPRDENRGYYDWNTLYSAAGFLEHFQKCEVSQVGRKVVPEYITHAPEDQRRSHSQFLGYLSNLVI